MALLSALDTASHIQGIHQAPRERHCLAQAPSLAVLSKPLVSLDDTKPPWHPTLKSWSDKIPQLSRAIGGSLLVLGCSVPIPRVSMVAT